MSNKTTYTTGQVSGMTQLPFMSLYRYVHDFNEFFSPEVQKRTRGRRWTDDDVILALTIQSLYRRRSGKELIRESIASGFRIEDLPSDSYMVREAMETLFGACMVYQEQAKADRAAAHDLALKLEKFYKKATLNEDEFLKLQKAVVNLISDVNNIYSRKYSLFTINQNYKVKP